MQECYAILDRDVRYGRKLSEALSESGERTAVFSEDAEGLSEKLAGKKPDVLLLDESLREEGLKKIRAGCAVLLTSLEGYRNIDGVPAVFRYQPVKTLLSDVEELRANGQKDGTVVTGQGRREVVGIYSPVGRAMKTEFALVLGQILSGGAKTALLSFDLFSPLGSFLPAEEAPTLSDLLYAYEEDGSPAADPKELVTKYHGLDLVFPAEAPEDLSENDPAEVLSRTLRFADDGGYDVTILDLGTDFRYLRNALPFLDKLYVPTVKDPVYENVTRDFLLCLERVVPEGRELSTEEVVLPRGRLFTGGRRYAEQLLWGPVGDYVRSILPKIG